MKFPWRCLIVVGGVVLAGALIVGCEEEVIESFPDMTPPASGTGAIRGYMHGDPTEVVLCSDEWHIDELPQGLSMVSCPGLELTAAIDGSQNDLFFFDGLEPGDYWLMGKGYRAPNVPRWYVIREGGHRAVVEESRWTNVLSFEAEVSTPSARVEQPGATTLAPSPTGEEPSPTLASPSPTEPAETRAELEALLKSMALRLEDLPSGFTLDEEKFTTNEEAAEDYPDGEEQGLADYVRWHRLLGYEAAYSTAPSLATLMTGGTIGIRIDTTIFQDAKGASEAMARGKERLSDPEERQRLVRQFQEENPEFQNVQFEPMSFAQVGDDTAAFQVTGELSDPESELEATAVYQYVVVRRGRGTGIVSVAAIQEPSAIQELESMVRKLDQQMKEALK